MKGLLNQIREILVGEAGADRVVPSTGAAAWLTLLAAGCMAFLAVLALSLGSAAGSLAEAWSGALENTATVRISVPEDEMAAQTETVLRVLQSTPGISSVRVVDDAEKAALLETWLGSDIGVLALPLPGMIEVIERDGGPDLDALLLRLQGEAPGASWDDHDKWRLPLVKSAAQLRGIVWVSLALIALAFVAIIALAAQAALAANTVVISTLRLVGATDTYIARAFVRRFTLRATSGAIAGTLICTLILLALPDAEAGSFLPSLRFSGAGWILPAGVPVFAGIVAFAATRYAALANLQRQP